MASELHAAAERLTTFLAGDQSAYEGTDESRSADTHALGRFACNLLDPTPLDEAWLKSVGFMPWEPGIHAGNVLELHCPDETWILVRIESCNQGKNLIAFHNVHGQTFTRAVDPTIDDFRWPQR